MVGTHFLVRYITDIAKIGSAVTFAPRPCLIPAELVGVRALLGQVYGFFDGAGLLWKEGTAGRSVHKPESLHKCHGFLGPRGNADVIGVFIQPRNELRI
jgi:hypothetical protein